MYSKIKSLGHVQRRASPVFCCESGADWTVKTAGDLEDAFRVPKGAVF